MNDEEFWSIELLRFKYRSGDQIIQTFWKIGPPQKLNPLLFNLYKFENPERSTPESYKMHWKLINGEEFGSKKLLKLKYRMGDEIIQTFCKSGSPHKLDPPSLIYTNLKTLRGVLLNHTKCMEILWMTKNLGVKNF